MALLLLNLAENLFNAFSARREKKNEENKIGNQDNPRVATRVGGEMVDAMNMQNMVLPGVAYKRLAKLRKTTRTVQRGSFDGKELSQWVYAFTRSLPSAETYLVVMNVGSEDEQVDLSNWPTLEEDETWQVHTPSVDAQYSIGYSFETNEFTLGPKSVMVLCNKKDLSSSSSLPRPYSLVFPLAMLVVAACYIVFKNLSIRRRSYIIMLYKIWRVLYKILIKIFYLL